MDYTTLHFYFLWFSIMVLICYNMKFPWWRVKTTLISGYEDKCLYCSYGLYWLTKVVVVNSAAESMTLLALNSCLGSSRRFDICLVQWILNAVRELMLVTTGHQWTCQTGWGQILWGLNSSQRTVGNWSKLGVVQWPSQGKSIPIGCPVPCDRS